MKRKILVPMFASVMALSMNTVANADEVKDQTVENKEDKTAAVIDLGEYVETTYKKAVVKDGVAVKIREEGSVQRLAYTGDEFKVLGTQGEWVKVKLEDKEGWLPARYVDVVEATGYTTGEKVNFRKDADTEAEIIEELEIGSPVKVLEDNGDWVKVKKGEEEGYIRGLYIADEAPVIEVEEEVEEVVVEEVKDEAQTINNNSTSSQTQNNKPSNNNSSNTNTNTNENANTNNNDSNEEVNPPASSSSAVQAVINLAYSKIGSPYVWGAEGPNSFDCSGFTSYVFKNAAGVSIPRTSGAQAGYGQTVSKSNLQPGDLVFFTTNGTGSVSHVGIYVGGGTMVHSPSSGKTVSTASINSSYYSSRFVTAKRVL